MKRAKSTVFARPVEMLFLNAQELNILATGMDKLDLRAACHYQAHRKEVR
jgi:hypothetical protein